MKSMFRLGLIGFLVALAPFARGQFSVSDDFSVSGTGNWGHQAFSGGGAFNVSAGSTQVLNYLDSGLAASGTSSGSRDWIPNTGSYTADWQVQIDFTFNLSQVNQQISSWSLYVGNLHDLTDNLHAMFLISKDNSGVTSRTVAGLFNTNGLLSPTTMPAHINNFPSNSLSFQASYLAATHTLSLAYDADGNANGYSFTILTSGVVDDPASLNWNLSPENSFGFRLVAENTAGANATSAIVVGQMFADNFAASSAIPEPATYAAAFGVLALLAAGWRRRQQ